MLIVGQSLELHRRPLADALTARAAAPLVERAREQVEAGAQALDLNLGTQGWADDFRWAVGALRRGGVSAELWLDGASAAELAAALDGCALAGLPGPLVANALPAGAALGAAEGALLAAAARQGAGLVISPRMVDRGGVAGAEPEWVVHEAVQAVERARGWGVPGPHYVDALAWPALLDVAGCRRSLDLLRRYRDAIPYAERLAAVGNVSHGVGREVGAALRQVYAAAAAGAGASALILPVEERAALRAALLGAGEASPRDEVEGYLVMVAQAQEAAVTPPPPPDGTPSTLHEAWRLIFDASRDPGSGIGL
ncbi:MAG: hypothetical protein M0R73_01230 [Dehalococcoidia bacterium]|nr:hypothetical protein [Dehalococcoidia bacterium]